MKKLKALIRLGFIISLARCTQLIVVALNQVELTKIFIQDNKMYLMGNFNRQSYQQVMIIALWESLFEKRQSTLEGSALL